jgi:RimJ/RimL family protein N-acetyltransferase
MRHGDGVQTREWIHEWLRNAMEQYDQRGFGPYAVLQQDNKAFLGYCGLFYFPNVNGKPEVEIGYRFARFAWGKGYATEAAIAVRDFAFSDLKLTRLIAIIDPSNAASIRVAEKLGMSHEQELMSEGYTHPDLVYAIVRA